MRLLQSRRAFHDSLLNPCDALLLVWTVRFKSELCYLACYRLRLLQFSRCKRDTIQARGFEPRDLWQTTGTACCKHAII